MILDITIGELDKAFGHAFLDLFGTNILMIGAFLSLMFIYFAFKIGVGIEGTIILGLFAIFYFTTPIFGTGLIPPAIAAAVVVIIGIILYRTFVRL